ncbi:MAG: 50S ribosomal protein L7/L12 [Patescibacteria group bacterium]
MANKKVTNSVVDKLVEEISKLTVLDLSELVTTLSEKLGVSAMPTAVAAVPTAAAGDAPVVAEESGGNQTVVMTNSGATKIAVIKALREINQQLGLKEAKDATDNVPYEVLKDAKPEDVKSVVEKLKTAGATIELK